MFPLTWPQADWAGGFVRLEPGTTKNRGGRAFPLIPELGALLEHRHDVTRLCERAQGRFIPWVFHRNGRPIKSSARAWRTAYFVGGLDGIRTRDLWIDSTRSLTRQKRAESPGNQAVRRRFRSRKLEFRSWFSLDFCDRLGSQRAKSRAKCSIYDAFFPASALPLAYLCRMLAIRV